MRPLPAVIASSPRPIRGWGSALTLLGYAGLLLLPLAAQVPLEFRTENAFPGLTFQQPLGIATAPGDNTRVFIVEKPGRIQVVTGLGTAPVKQVFLDLTSRPLVTDGEGGLLGLAFHPQFATNRHFYVFYTLNATTAAGTGLHDRLARFTALPPPATNADILATEVPLLTQFDEASNHNGGDLHFGPDGYLYVALGDEGGGNDQFNNSQRIDRDFFAGLLRLDVDLRAGNLAPNAHPAVHAGAYRVPADNPFVGATAFNGAAVNPAQVRTEFWAVGLRNPWRFSFDAPTGRLFLGDVGQSAREEINLVTRGGNYGWAYREGLVAGPRANPPAGVTFADPIWDAERTLAASITGGVVYRGARFPALAGRYVFGDFIRNRIFAMTLPASGPVQVETLLTESGPAGFGTDPQQGDVLIASLSTGAIRRLVLPEPPVVTGQPVDQAVTLGRDVSISAGLTGSARRWQVSTDNGATWTDLADNATYSGTSSPVLTIATAPAALSGNLYRLVASNSGGSTASAGARLTVAPLVFPAPAGLAFDPSGNLHVGDSTNNTLHRVTPAGAATLLAGSAGLAGSADGSGAAARFNLPAGLAPGTDGAVFVADSANATIRSVSATGVVATFAGTPDVRGNSDGPRLSATFSNPQDVARDAAGNLFVADSTNHTIRRIAAGGTVTTLAGAAGASGSADGAGATARFNRPTGVAVDAAGNVFVADSFNNTIRRIAPDGTVATLAGVVGVGGAQDGSGSGATFNRPVALALDGGGNLLVADEGNHAIRRVTPAGVVSTVAGLPTLAGKKDGVGSDAWFSHPRAVAVDAVGNILVADAGNAALRRIAASGQVTTLALSEASAPPPATPSPPSPSPAPPAAPPAGGGGGGGGGGAVSGWFLVALAVLWLARWRSAGAQAGS